MSSPILIWGTRISASIAVSGEAEVWIQAPESSRCGEGSERLSALESGTGTCGRQTGCGHLEAKDPLDCSEEVRVKHGKQNQKAKKPQRIGATLRLSAPR